MTDDVFVIAPKECHSGYDISIKKIYHRRFKVYSNTALYVTYLSAIETLICHREIVFNRFYFFRLCTNHDT